MGSVRTATVVAARITLKHNIRSNELHFVTLIQHSYVTLLAPYSRILNSTVYFALIIRGEKLKNLFSGEGAIVGHVFEIRRRDQLCKVEMEQMWACKQ